jgi:hypothetical protein
MASWNRRQFLGEAMAAPILGVAVGSAVADEPKVVHPQADVNDAVRTQVLVVGAGASGVPAALAAARTGAKVILLEEDSIPGGAPVDMYVSMICGDPIVGIYAEMMALLDRDFHLTAKPTGNPSSSLWFMPSAYTHVIFRMVSAEPNLQLWCSATMIEALVSEGARNRIRGVTVRRADGRLQTIEADVVIDATGGGVVGALAGCECRYGTEAKSEFNEPLGPDKPSDEVQHCTLMLVSQRLRPDARIDLSKLRGYMAVPAEGGNACLQWAGTVPCADTRSSVAIAQAHRESLLKSEDDIAYVYESGFAVHIAPRLGVREMRRVVGDHILTVNDLMAPKRPDDTVAVGAYPVDTWGQPQYDESPIAITPGGYGIPFQVFLTKGMENLLVVGKCLSATHLAMSAVRVQCIVAQMGQAAGTAAAMAVQRKTDLRCLPLSELQATLKIAGIPI